MVKKLGISLSEEQNYYLCELAKRWGQKKSNILGNYLEESAEKESIIYEDRESDADKHQYHLNRLSSKVQVLTLEHKSIRETIKSGSGNLKLAQRSGEIKNQIEVLQIFLDEEQNNE